MSASPLQALEPALEALLRALAGADAATRRAKMAAIDELLAGLNPLERALGFAHVHRELGHPDKAAGVLEDLLAVMGDDAMVRFQIGTYLREAGKPDEALQAFGRAAGIDPSMVPAWLACGTILDARGEPDEAIGCYRHALLAAPQDPDVWRNLGNALSAQRKFDEAAKAYATALGFAPESDTLHVLHSSVYAATGDIDRANALLPARVRAEVGRVHEVDLSVSGVALRCRFHATEARVGAAERVAVQLLAEVARDPEPTRPRSLRAGAVFVVRDGRHALVCDPDSARPGAPHRFFDASEAVRGR